MTLTLLAGMPEEVHHAKQCFDEKIVQILHGTDKLNLDKVVSNTCTRIVSFGLAGGLRSGVPVGSVLIANSLVDGSDQPYALDQKLIEALLYVAKASGMNMAACPWYSSGSLDTADTVPQREALYKKTGAWAIDDESYYAAVFAKKHNISFGIVRSISDDASETLPLAATGAILNKDGSANLGYLLRALAREPLHDTLDLFHVAKDFLYSLNTLEYAGKVWSSTLQS